MRRALAPICALALLVGGIGIQPAGAAPAAASSDAAGDRLGDLLAGLFGLGRLLPDEIELPIGFQPEGIAIDPVGLGYVGSIPTGAIYRFWAVTGDGEVLVPPTPGRSAVGLAIRGGRLFVAGGATGQGYVYDRFTGDELAAFQLADLSSAPGQPPAPTFVNDVVVTDEAAWFTDSQRPVLYRVPVSGGGAPEVVPLGGEIVYQDGFNLNGIDATPDGDALVVAQSNVGRLFVVDPATGEGTAIAVTDDAGDDVALPNADGILLRDGRLWVVRNFDLRIEELALAADLRSATLVATLTDPRLDVPTTIAPFLGRLYVVNARFGAPDPATTEYSVVALRP